MPDAPGTHEGGIGIECDYCHRETPLDRILRRFLGLGPTLFICPDCKEKESHAS